MHAYDNDNHDIQSLLKYIQGCVQSTGTPNFLWTYWRYLKNISERSFNAGNSKTISAFPNFFADSNFFILNSFTLFFIVIN